MLIITAILIIWIFIVLTIPLAALMDYLAYWKISRIKKDIHRHVSGRIIRNACQCKVCGKILVSTHRHDFQQCECPNKTYTDGGLDYINRGGRDMSKVYNLDLPNGIYGGGGIDHLVNK